MKFKGALSAVALSLLTSACGIPSADERVDTARGIAAAGGLTSETISAGGFQHAVYSRLRAPSPVVRVYLEGDGFAWVTPVRISDDPTPIDPLLLRIVARDPGESVAYLARPCQYTLKIDRRCAPVYWAGTLKFGPDIVAAVDAAVSEVKRRARAEKIELVGYSGGGAIAVLVAARRNDVQSIRTIAGNLDHVWLHAHHGVSQLPGSLNAIDYAARMATVPQLHFSGGDDRVVPPEVAQRYVGASGTARCARQRIVAGATHTERWLAQWPGLLADPPRCG